MQRSDNSFAFSMYSYKVLHNPQSKHYCIAFTNGEIEAQRNSVVCPRLYLDSDRAAIQSHVFSHHTVILLS